MHLLHGGNSGMWPFLQPRQRLAVQNVADDGSRSAPMVHGAALSEACAVKIQCNILRTVSMLSGFTKPKKCGSIPEKEAVHALRFQK